MLADAIAVLLDSTAQVGGSALGAMRQQASGHASSLQAQLGQAVFSSLSTFTYRLPLRNLLAHLHIKFARQLLALLLTGDPDGDLSKPLEIDANRETAGTNPRNHAISFMYGRTDSGPAPLPLQLAGAIQANRSLAEFHEAIIDVGLRSQKEDLASYLDYEARDFAAYLRDGLWLILNGKAGTSPQVARTGKLAYVQAFLQELSTLLRQASQVHNWEARNKKLPRWASQTAQVLPQILQLYISYTNKLAKQLSKQEEILRTMIYGKAQNDGPSASVLEEFDRREVAARKGLFDLDQIRDVRRYLLVERDAEAERQRAKLLDTWYQSYFAPNLGKAIAHLAWHVSAEQLGPSLTVRVGEPQSYVLETEQVAHFTDGMIALAEHASQEVWNPDKSVRLLADAIQPILANQFQIGEIQQRSEPVLPYIAGGVGQHAVHQRWLCCPGPFGNDTWQQVRTALNQALARQAVTPLSIVDSTDLFSCTLLQVLDYVPTTVIARIAILENTYTDYYGMVARHGAGAVQANLAMPEPSAVFPAERRASEIFERRMIEMPERTAWILSSLFVGALDRLARAELFLRAFAADFVQVRVVGLNRISILTLNGEDLWLIAPNQAGAQAALEVLGMQNFVLDTDDHQITDQPAWPHREARLEQAIASLGIEELHKRWGTFDAAYLNRPRNPVPLGLDDMIICTRILIRIQLGMLL